MCMVVSGDGARWGLLFSLLSSRRRRRRRRWQRCPQGARLGPAPPPAPAQRASILHGRWARFTPPANWAARFALASSISPLTTEICLCQSKASQHQESTLIVDRHGEEANSRESEFHSQQNRGPKPPAKSRRKAPGILQNEPERSGKLRAGRTNELVAAV